MFSLDQSQTTDMEELSKNRMGSHELQKPRMNCANNEEVLHEMYDECREVASELRMIGDLLEKDYHQRTGFNDSKRIMIGAAILGIATSIMIGYLSRVLT